MPVTAKEVGDLRKATGAGLMDCKKALTESGGDFEGAMDYLRKKGQKVAAKRADRDANEGVCIAITDESGKKGVAMALSCETDFVAKNEEFIGMAKELAEMGLASGATSAEQLNGMDWGGTTVAEKLVDYTGKVGEKTEISEYSVVEGDAIASYVHAGAKIGVLVSYKDGGKEGAADFFRKLAMHIAAMAPSIMHPSEFDDELVQKELEGLVGQIKVENEDRERLGKPLKTVPQFASRRQLTDEVMAKVEADIKEELKAEGKPEKIWDKIIPGKIERFIADNTLLDQERCLMAQVFALDDTKSVEAAVKDFHEDAEVIAFKRVAVG